MIPKTSRYSNPVNEYSPVYTYWMAYLMTLSDWVMSCQAWPPHARCGEWARCKHWRLAVYFFYKIACFNGVYLTHCHTNSTGISIWHKNRYTSSSKLGGSLLFVIFNYQTLWGLQSCDPMGAGWNYSVDCCQSLHGNRTLLDGKLQHHFTTPFCVTKIVTAWWRPCDRSFKSRPSTCAEW